jgi:hypothetical protein
MNDDEELAFNEAMVAISRLAGALAESLAPFAHLMVRPAESVSRQTSICPPPGEVVGGVEYGIADRAKPAAEAGAGMK